LRNVLPAVAPVSAVLLAAVMALSGFGTAADHRAPSSCAVIYRVTDEWAGGFASSVTVINTGDASINGWALKWTFPNGQTTLDVWNGVASVNGATVTVRNSSDNATVAPASTAVFRFTGAAVSRNEQPADFNLNGRLCTLA
jgi:hypothetical protein